MSRFKAATLHFLISLTVVATIITIMFTLWFPNAYFKLMGGKTLIYLIAGVDVFLGPLLTFVVFKSGKKWLKFDLACIAMLQVAAMSYGLYVMFEARPIFTVFNKNAFYVASVVDIVPNELAKGKKIEWRTASITGPRLVAATALDKKNKLETVFYETETQMGVAQQYPRLYDDYVNHFHDVIKAGKPLSMLAEMSLENKLTVNKFLVGINRPMSEFLFLPIYSATGVMSAIVEAKTGHFIEIVDARPKEISQKN
ncbi:MAG: TfpX/TfpZ family type IV pilin accessory protein [Pseudomonadota bacterium]